MDPDCLPDDVEVFKVRLSVCVGIKPGTKPFTVRSNHAGANSRESCCLESHGEARYLDENPPQAGDSRRPSGARAPRGRAAPYTHSRTRILFASPLPSSLCVRPWLAF